MGDWLGTLTALAHDGLDSPYLWLVVFLVAGLDALVPFMPSETTVVTAAVLLGPHPPDLALLTAVAATGALFGDCLSYGAGRRFGPRAVARLLRGERGGQRWAWGRTMVARHATTLIVAARFVPGGRVTSGLVTGTVGFPLRRFLALDALGSGIWAVTSTAIGLIGGAAFRDDPVKGLALSFALAAAVVAVTAALPTAVRRCAGAGGEPGPAEEGGPRGAVSRGAGRGLRRRACPTAPPARRARRVPPGFRFR
ncbi:DedA family protein [Streptomyces axinellae]|uniref:VTT domain-containing protein n=1 Tax=Streptomyces axinellae TaxID=552788 RepID=A0ABN3PST9_9ACTN